MRPVDWTPLVLLAMVACSHADADMANTLPPLALRPMLEELRALASRDATPRIELDLRHADAAIRRDAATQLADLGHASGIPGLLLALKDEKDTGVRLHFAQALARLGNLSALPDLIAGMVDDRFARAAGLFSMRILQDHYRSPGDRPSYQFLRRELTTLHRLWLRRGRAPRATGSELDAATESRLARHLVDLEGFQLRQVDEARFVLSRLGAAGIPLLQSVLHAKETYLRQHAMEVLELIGAPGRAAARLVLAQLGDPMFRSQAARTLGALGDQDVVPHLLILLADPDLDTRCAAAGAFGPLRDQRATGALRKILANETEPMDLRVYAASSLAILDPRGNGLRFLLDRLDAEDYHRPTVEELIERAERVERE
jgi:HEAT repeat protein